MIEKSRELWRHGRACLGHDRDEPGRLDLRDQARLYASDFEKILDVKAKQGAAPFTVEMNRDDRNNEIAWDGKSFGRLKVKGVAVAKILLQERGREILDHDGFFDTGDVATIDPYGMMQINRRSKDVSSNPVANGFHRSIWKISRSVTPR